MRLLRFAIQVLVIYLAQLTFCHAVSFECRTYIERRACPETLICSEESLSRLDDLMASLYQTARARMPPALLGQFRDYQREWLAKRDSCGCNYQCLASEYRTQIDALRKTIRGTGQ